MTEFVMQPSPRAVFDLPATFDDGVVFRFMAPSAALGGLEHAPFSLMSANTIVLMGVNGVSEGHYVIPTSGRAYLELEGRHLRNQNGDVVESVWITKRISGTWKIE